MPAQTSFTSGELSPRLDGRIDIGWWGAGAREMTNMQALPHGPAMRRPGTRFVAAAKHADKTPRLVPFVFSDVDTHMLEFTDQAIRIFRQKAAVLSGGSPVEVVTPYLEADLATLQWEQSFDVVHLVHGDHEPAALSRASLTSWSIADLVFVDGPWFDENTDATMTLQPSAASGTGVTVTAVGHSPFAATDVGRLVRIKHGATWGYLRITGYTSATVVTGDVVSAFGATTAQATWQLGLWSATDGYPRTITSHEERFVYGGAGGAPMRFDASKTGDFTNFTPGTNDDDPIAWNLGGGLGSAIRWMASGRVLLVGTLGPVFRVGADSLNNPLTPSNIATRPEVFTASELLAPVQSGRALIFKQRGGRKLRELHWAIEADGYIAPDITRRSDHLSQPGLSQMAFQDEPWSILWANRTDGRLLGFTYVREEEVFAWSNHTLGGTDAVVESVASIPGGTGNDDELWLAVSRTVNGATARHIEVMEPWFTDTALVEDAWFVDCGIDYDGRSNPAATLTFASTTGSSVDVAASADVFSGAAAGDRLVMGGTVADGVLTGEGRATVVTVHDARNLTVRIDVDLSALTWASGTWQFRDQISSLSGLSHLEGETVAILGDGAAYPHQVVSGGAVAIDPPAGRVICGLPYTSRLSPQRFEAGTREGPAQSRKQKVSSLGLRVYRSGSFELGRDDTGFDPVSLRDAQDRMDLALPLFTGDVVQPFPGTWSRDARVVLRQAQPLPFMVTMVLPRFGVNEG